VKPPKGKGLPSSQCRLTESHRGRRLLKGVAMLGVPCRVDQNAWCGT